MKDDNLYPLPQKFIERMQAEMDDEYGFFIAALAHEPVTAVRLNPAKHTSDQLPKSERIAWHPQGYFLAERPAFVTDPIFHAGGYYVQEASSMFIDYVVKFLAGQKKLTAFADLCAAPGGKSTVLADNLPEDGVLLCNEIIHTRNNILRENLAKWGVTQAVVTQQNIADIAAVGALFDVVLIDAPCSGEGLFRRSAEATTEWSEDNVNKCAIRQTEILDDAIQLVKPGGYLIYSTCTFESAENIEQILQLHTKYNLNSIAIPLCTAEMVHNITPIEKENAIGYSFYPHKTKGEGFFCSVLQLNEELHSLPKHKSKPLPKATAAEVMAIAQYADIGNKTVLKFGQYYYALTDALIAFYPFIQSLHIKSIGVKLGEIKGKDFIPSQELALSPLLHPDCPKIALTGQDALRYLKTESVPAAGRLGWAVVSYLGYVLGWIKILNGRVNNYFPKEWKIRKEIGV